MTVRELIDELQRFPDNLEVRVQEVIRWETRVEWGPQLDIEKCEHSPQIVTIQVVDMGEGGFEDGVDYVQQHIKDGNL